MLAASVLLWVGPIRNARHTNRFTMSEPDSQPLSPPATTLPIGTVIAEKYRVDGVLGAGGMGVVLSATNLDLDAPVAIKLVRDEFSHNEEVVSRMVLEARSAAKLHGRHMVRVLDVARLDNGTPYIVMERLAGCDLATVLNEHGPLPVREAVDYVVQACEGLAEAHALGIVHRDLKPENLFLAQTPEGPVLKILDFGVSKIIASAGRASPRTALTNAGVAVGSPYYMSPEQMRASPYVDARADIWSLGTVLFELLTGKCPFEGESVQVVCALVLSMDPPSLLGFSPEAPLDLDHIVRRCLRKNPNERYPNVDALGAELRAFLSSGGVAGADRDLRIASGISLIPKASLAVTRAFVSGSSPTLPSRLEHQSPALGHARDLSPEEPSPPHRSSRVAASILALSVAAGAAGLWHFRAELLPESRAAQATLRVVPTMPATLAAPTPVAAVTALPKPEPELRAPPASPRDPPPTSHIAALPAPKASPVTARVSMPRATANASNSAPQSASKSSTQTAAAAFDDLAASASPPSSARAPVNAWSTDSLGGRY